jgi:hypothetical protein
MFSQGGGDDGIAEQGHASPIDTPSIRVRVAGQIVDKPSIRTDQSVGSGIIGTEEAWVEGCDRR